MVFLRHVYSMKGGRKEGRTWKESEEEVQCKDRDIRRDTVVR
jgi:hypothetical protein